LSHNSGGEITRLLVEWRCGDGSACDRLAALVYPELRRLARYHLRASGHGFFSSTELVHEAWLRLLGGSAPEVESRTHFYSIAARAMRQVLTDWARRTNSTKRGAGHQLVSLDSLEWAPAAQASDLIALDDALNTLSQFDPRKSAALEMRFFGGMTAEEIAGALEISASTVHREIRAATAWLRARLAPLEP
jgi:RNA polymerase sigma factor (TIGR02999 family)